MSRARLKFVACLLALLGLVALGVWAAPGIWLADGVPLRRPIDLTRAGLWRLVVQQPVDTVLLLKLSFVVPRAEWKGPLPGDGREGAPAVPVDGLTLEYGLVIRDAGGAVVTTRKGGELGAQLTGGTTGRGDVEVLAWLPSLNAARNAEYDVALKVINPVNHPRAARAELAVIPIRPPAHERVARWVLTALWILAAVSLAVMLVRLRAAAGPPPR